MGHFECDKCSRTFDRKYNLIDHIRTHTKEKPFSCHVCGRGFSTRSNLNTHTKLHAREGAFQCRECGVGYSQESNLNRHINATHEGRIVKGFDCSECGKRYFRERRLKRHIMVAHRGIRGPFRCSECDKGYSYKCSLNRHKRVKHQWGTVKETENPCLPSEVLDDVVLPDGKRQRTSTGDDDPALPYRKRQRTSRGQDDDVSLRRRTSRGQEDVVLPDGKRQRTSRGEDNDVVFPYGKRQRTSRGQGDDANLQQRTSRGQVDDASSRQRTSRRYAWSQSDGIQPNSGLNAQVLEKPFKRKDEFDMLAATLLEAAQAAGSSSSSVQDIGCGGESRHSMLAPISVGGKGTGNGVSEYNERREQPLLSFGETQQVQNGGNTPSATGEERFKGTLLYNPIRCEFLDCVQSFSAIRGLEEHTRQVHPGEKLFRCEFQNCGKRFARKRYLDQHKLTHEKCFKCDFQGCTKGPFASKYILQNHKLQHLDRHKLKLQAPGNSFGCKAPKCDKGFPSKASPEGHTQDCNPKKFPDERSRPCAQGRRVRVPVTHTRSDSGVYPPRLGTEGAAEVPCDFETLEECTYSDPSLAELLKAYAGWKCTCEPKSACQDSSCINRYSNVECSSGTCHGGCGNQRFQKKQYARVTVVKAGDKGYALKAVDMLEPGDFVMEYVGEVIDEKTLAIHRSQYRAEGIPHEYIMKLDPRKYIDATKKGNLARFCNHSCSPNCRIEKWIVGCRQRLGVFANKHISQGEELVFDYDFDPSEDQRRCLCGEANCRGYIVGKGRKRSAVSPHPVPVNGSAAHNFTA